MNRIRFALMAAGALLFTTSAVLAGEAVAIERVKVAPRAVSKEEP